MGFDAIIIGSGFGGSINACRLTQAGMKVLVLERGRRWEPEAAPGVTAYPRNLTDPWIWDQGNPLLFNGWTDLRLYKGMAVVCGAGVGGGSLIYANVSIVPPPTVFQSPWPKEITFAELQPYFDEVATMLDVQEIPEPQLNPEVLREAGVVILSNCGGLNGQHFAWLRDFVAAGGGLIVFPGDRTCVVTADAVTELSESCNWLSPSGKTCFLQARNSIRPSLRPKKTR